MSKEVLGIIPARGGSKGIVGKNLRPLCGRPLIQYTINAAQSSRLISRLILSSDSEEIISYCKPQHLEVPFIRPPELARDATPMIAVVKHAFTFLKKEQRYQPDFIILLQPTSPLRTAAHIDQALEKLMRSRADSIVSVVDVPHQFRPVSVMKRKGDYLQPFIRGGEKRNLRQFKPVVYGRNGPAILAFTYGCIKKGSMYGKKILPYFMNKEESIDIDDEFDFAVAQFLIEKTAGIHNEQGYEFS